MDGCLDPGARVVVHVEILRPYVGMGRGLRLCQPELELAALRDEVPEKAATGVQGPSADRTNLAGLQDHGRREEG
jgi:hypothetical protein